MFEKMEIDGATKTVCLIGTPVAHSLSPLIHNTSFSALGLDYVYVCHDVDKPHLPDAVRGMSALGFAGFNVTMPLKTDVMDLLDEVDPTARLIGACNVVVCDDGRLTGYNFDGAGVMRALSEKGVDIRGRRMTLIGPGGAGRAIYTQAAMDGARSIDVFKHSRTGWDQTISHIRQVADATSAKLALHPLDDGETLRAAIASSDVLVDASSVGMAPDILGCNVEADMLHDDLTVCEVVYEPRTTVLIERAREAGCGVVDGLDMLFWQAALSEQLWTGVEMPVETVKARILTMTR